MTAAPERSKGTSLRFLLLTRCLRLVRTIAEAMAAAPERSKGTSLRFLLLTRCFVLVALAWIVHAIITKFGVTLFGFAISVPFWKVTEVSSIVVTLVVSVAFWLTYVKGGIGHTAILKGASPGESIAWFVCLAIFALAFGGAAIIACIEGSIVGQISSLAVGALAAVLIGYIAMRTTFAALRESKKRLQLTEDVPERQRIAREVLDKIDARDNISKFLCFSDIPIAVAMVMVLLLVALWVNIADSGKEIRIFIAGAVALQLLYSNSVYWIEAFADTPRGREWLKHRSPPFQTVTRMLVPEELPDGMTEIERAEAQLKMLFPQDYRAGTLELKPTSDVSRPKDMDAADVLASNTGDD
jgi:hypothetical protein